MLTKNTVLDWLSGAANVPRSSLECILGRLGVVWLFDVRVCVSMLRSKVHSPCIDCITVARKLTTQVFHGPSFRAELARLEENHHAIDHLFAPAVVLRDLSRIGAKAVKGYSARSKLPRVGWIGMVGLQHLLKQRKRILVSDLKLNDPLSASDLLLG